MYILQYLGHILNFPNIEINLFQDLDSKSGVTRIRRYAYVERSLKSLPEMPDIWQCVRRAHNSSGDVIHDLCEGTYIQIHPLFHRNNSALQIILYTYEIELVNPIGAHVKKP